LAAEMYSLCSRNSAENRPESTGCKSNPPWIIQPAEYPPKCNWQAV